ncbi:TadE/TadG family type IV pilus assembly protein [Novilysobacter spongiicola]|uniref:TadE-like protein n=1 Tax=Lysobacter spongiicola DSM 21749 TaxID=1122188 RepID=A0A1T4PYP0_9GAMM|nr:TadE/TadG family type IV pilus assembly protein [Lysobacter spongiicola]SJZ96559.1 TadE-like protein [Lysobacter spongiicola DSM 21749]
MATDRNVINPSGAAGPAGRSQRGQSLVEFIIVVPAFLFLVLAAFQFMLIYRAKATLDYATLEAARSGAVNGADIGEIREGLIRGLAPLYADSPGVGGAIEGMAKAGADVALYSDIDIVSPTRQAWNEFAERQWDGRRALPNDNLAFRDNRVGSSGVSVQDANVLKIRVRYCYPMIVPFVDRVIGGFSRLITEGDTWRQDLRCSLGHYSRMRLESYAIVRMQSPLDKPSGLR